MIELTAILGALLAGAVWLLRRAWMATAESEAEKDAIRKDMDRAKDIEDRADAARRDARDGDADERLRRHGKLRD